MDGKNSGILKQYFYLPDVINVSTLTFKASIIVFEIKINGTKKFGNDKKAFYKCVLLIYICIVYENYLDITMHRTNHSTVFKETPFLFWEH